jgi:hypothetical protein
MAASISVTRCEPDGEVPREADPGLASTVDTVVRVLREKGAVIERDPVSDHAIIRQVKPKAKGRTR